MNLVRRASWGAPTNSPAAYLRSARGVKIHYLGTEYDSRQHSRCDDYVRRIRADHLSNSAEDYVDIAYNAVVCEHGSVYEGRGLHRRSGANGNADLNSRDYAVCALLGSDGLTKPPKALLHGLRDAIEWFRRSGEAGEWIGGHRDGYATECPGDPLYAWVRAGAPRPGGGDGGGGGVPPFPGRGAFVIGRRDQAVTDLDVQLTRLGFVRHHDGDGYQPGPLFTEHTRRNVADLQRSRPELAGDPDGYPGPMTWRLAHTLPG